MDIQLYAEQEEWVEKSSEMLREYGAYLDNSMAGLGKTIVVLEHCKRMDIPLTVICPVNAISVWEYETEKYGVEATIVTYDQLSRGSKEQSVIEIIDKTYYVTDDFYDKMEEGMMIAADEIHLALNNSDRRNAVMALAAAQRDMFLEGKDVYLALLSATPGHSAQHTRNIMCLLGIVSGTCDISDSSKNSLLAFAKSLIESLGDEDIKELYEQLVDRRSFTLEKLEQFIVSVYNSRVKGIHTGAIERKIGRRAKVYNAFFFSDDEGATDVVSAMSEFGVVKDSAGNAAKRSMQSVMQAIERSVLRSIVTFINYLIENPESADLKVVLFVNYVESIDYIEENLHTVSNPLFITGKQSSEERAENIRAFQEPNMDYPFICLNMKAGASSISLDDRDGSFPRATFIIPSYSYIDDFQAIYRVDRGPLTKSDPYVYICFPRLTSSDFNPEKDADEELESIATQYNVLNNIRAKSTTAKYIKDMVEDAAMVDLMRNPAVVVNMGEIVQLPPVKDVEGLEESQGSENIIQGWIDSGKNPKYIESLFAKNQKKKAPKARKAFAGITRGQKIRQLRHLMKKEKWTPEQVPDGILSSFGLEVKDLLPREKDKGPFQITYYRSNVNYG